MSRRLGVLLALVGVAIVVVGVVFVALILRQAAAPTAQSTVVPPVTVPVVVATHALPVRSLVRAGDVNVVQMPAEFVPLDALSTAADAVGKITMIPLATGELVLGHHLADPTNISQDLAFIIGDDQVVMAFPATDLMSQVDVLKPGDLVDILVSVEEPVLPNTAGGAASGGGAASASQQNKELFTFDALQRLTIQAIVVNIKPSNQSGGSSTTASASSVGGTPAPTPTLSPDQIQPQAILVALAPQDALVLKHLKDAGGIADIVLRAPTSSQAFDVKPVSPEYLIDRYGLVIAQPGVVASPTPAQPGPSASATPTP
jgi:pilus assembly protein CpaB